MMPRTFHPSELRYLSAATDYSGSGPNRQACIQWAAALTLDLRASRAILTFGTLRPGTPEERFTDPRVSDVPFIHAWVEVGDWMYAPTLLERLGEIRPFPCVDYYRVNEVRDVCRVPRDKFDAIVKRFGLAAALKHRSKRAGSGELADALLQAAGVRYILSEHRSVLPAA
jgi:hypothetical protein